MCKLKSAIVLKNKIFMPDYDSHSDMLKELGIEDDFIGASKKFVRVELSPVDGDPFSDMDAWALKVDQHIRPDWFSEEEYKPQIVSAVKEWANTHIYIGVNDLKLEVGTNYYIKDCQNVVIYGSASVKAWGSAVVFNSSFAKWQKQDSLILSENATFKDNAGKVIYQSGDYNLISVESGKTIADAKA